MVNRAIVRVVTAGTLTEEALLDSRARQLAGRGGPGRRALRPRRRRRLDRPLRARLGRRRPRSTPSWRGSARPRSSRPSRSPASTCSERSAGFDSLAAERRLKERFEVATLDGFGSFDRAALCAAGGLLAYLDEVARDSLPFLRPPVARAVGRSYDDRRGDPREPGADRLGRAARAPAACSPAVDRTVTGAGARLLAADLGAPLLDRAAIEARLDLVALFERDSGAARAGCGGSSSALPDIGRALGRLVAGRGGPRDLGQLRDGLDEARRLHDRLAALPDPPALLAALLPALTGHGALVDLLVARAGAVAADRRRAGRLYRRGL